MKKCFCDICEHEIPEIQINISENLNFAIYSNGKEWDICNACRCELGDWLKSKKKYDDKEKEVVKNCDNCGNFENASYLGCLSCAKYSNWVPKKAGDGK